MFPGLIKKNQSMTLYYSWIALVQKFAEMYLPTYETSIASSMHKKNNMLHIHIFLKSQNPRLNFETK